VPFSSGMESGRQVKRGLKKGTFGLNTEDASGKRPLRLEGVFVRSRRRSRRMTQSSKQQMARSFRRSPEGRNTGGGRATSWIGKPLHREEKGEGAGHVKRQQYEGGFSCENPVQQEKSPGQENCGQISIGRDVPWGGNISRSACNNGPLAKRGEGRRRSASSRGSNRVKRD